MAQTVYYRYVSRGEIQYIQANKHIMAKSGVTYFTPDRYDDPRVAQSMLAMPNKPDYRIGPIPADEMPDFDVVGIQSVGVVDASRPGGGVEAATSATAYLFATYDFASGAFVNV